MFAGRGQRFPGRGSGRASLQRPGPGPEPGPPHGQALHLEVVIGPGPALPTAQMKPSIDFVPPRSCFFCSKHQKNLSQEKKFFKDAFLSFRFVFRDQRNPFRSCRNESLRFESPSRFLCCRSQVSFPTFSKKYIASISSDQRIKSFNKNRLDL